MSCLQQIKIQKRVSQLRHIIISQMLYIDIVCRTVNNTPAFRNMSQLSEGSDIQLSLYVSACEFIYCFWLFISKALKKDIFTSFVFPPQHALTVIKLNMPIRIIDIAVAAADNDDIWPQKLSLQRAKVTLCDSPVMG